MLGLARYESSLCGCGLPSDYADTDPDLQLDYRTCPVCRDLERAKRAQQKADDDEVRSIHGKQPPPEADLPADGRYLRLGAKSAGEDGAA